MGALVEGYGCYGDGGGWGGWMARLCVKLSSAVVRGVLGMGGWRDRGMGE